MSQSQEFRGSLVNTDADKAAVRKAVQIIDENLELSHSNDNQQMRSGAAQAAAYTAYDAIERHVSFKKSQRSYNETRGQYEEKAYSSDTSPPVHEAAPEEHTGTQPSVSVSEWRSPSIIQLEESVVKSPYDSTASLGKAETPKLWKNTHAQQTSEALQGKLDNKRKEAKRIYTRLAYDSKNGRRHYFTKRKRDFEFRGRDIDMVRMGRLKFTGQVVLKKITKREYEKKLEKQEKKDFRRRATGRLLFRNGKTIVDEEIEAEDDTIRRMKGTVRNTGRMMAASTRRNIRTLKLQNNVYARYELEELHGKVLKDKRTRLLAEEKMKQQKEMLRQAKSREQKKKLKKQMVQQRAIEDGNFIRRTTQSMKVKRRARRYQEMTRKKLVSTVVSLLGVILFFLIIGVVLFLGLIALFTGGSHYYVSTVTQNDYGTITDATEYFRKLETDLDEYLNADRDALETDIAAEYGEEIYEFIYDLADFGFSANTLIAYLSAMYGSFTLEDVREELDSIFEEMYTLTVEVKKEEREIRRIDPVTGDEENVTELKNICYITLEKKELEEIADERLPEDRRYQYDGYRLATGGQQVYGPVMREDWTNLISSNFGERIHPITKERKTHSGVDIAVPTGTRIYSAVKGTVILAAYSSSAGNWVKVQTDTGWTVVMMHMDSLAVTAGQKVEQGDFLGYSGNTGNSTGPHLHLEVRDPDNKAINPIFIIPQTCAGTGKEAEE